MRFIFNVPHYLIAPFLSIVLFYRRFRYGYSFNRIPVATGKYTIVDPDDYQELLKFDWFLNETYACGNQVIDGKCKMIRMHRKIMNPAKGLVVDHINGNRLDNRKANLRIATYGQNNCNNKSRPHSSRFKGVYWDKRRKKFVARIAYDGKRPHLGFFDDEVAAAKVYDAAARKYQGQFAYLNFPDENDASSS